MYRKILLSTILAIASVAILVVLKGFGGYFELFGIIAVAIGIITHYFVHVEHAPIEKSRRRITWFSVFLSILTLLFFGFVPVNLVLVGILVITLIAHFILIEILSRPDTSDSAELTELFDLQIVGSAIILVLSYWQYGQLYNIDIMLLKYLTLSIPVLLLFIVFIHQRTTRYLVAASVIALMAIKIALVPEVGIQQIVIYILFGILIGYIESIADNYLSIKYKYGVTYRAMLIAILVIIVTLITF